MTYYNTTNESGATLNNNVAKAKSQEEEILNLFIFNKMHFINQIYKNYKLGLSPSQIGLKLSYNLNTQSINQPNQTR